jgi:hypothetical protein
MQSEVNGILQSLDGLKSQIEDRKSAARTQKKELGETLEKSLSEELTKIAEVSGKLTAPELTDRPAIGETPRLDEKIQDLFASVNGVNAGPTKAQTEYFGQIAAERDRLREEFRGYLRALATVNESLRAGNLPVLLLPAAESEPLVMK